MAQPHHAKAGSRKNPEVSISVKYEVAGEHDPAALEGLLEFFRELARSKESSKIDQENK